MIRNIDVLKALKQRVNATASQLAKALDTPEADVQEQIDRLLGMRLVEAYLVRDENVYCLSRQGKNIVGGIYRKLQKEGKNND